MHIGTKIRKLRGSKGFIQEYMAMHLAISQSKYCNIESNKTSIDFEVLLKVAALLQTDLKEFIPEKYNFFNIQDNHDHAVSGWTIHTKDIAYEQNLLQQLKDKDKIIALQDEKIKALTHEITMLNSHTKK